MTDDETLDVKEELDNPEDQESPDESPEVSSENGDESQEVIEPEVIQEDDEIETLKKELKASEEQNAELKDRMLRTQADFENYKKRSQREKDDLTAYVKGEVIKKLLPVLDNFDLALSHSSTENPEAYKKGVELVAKQLRDTLDSEGLKEIEAEGQPFDPNFHHGVAVDNNPEIDDQHITEVFQKGYELKGKVLRPSMVKVNQN